MTAWTIDATHSTIEFSVRHMMITTVKGIFSGVQGAIHFDPAQPTAASAEGTVDVATINTRDAQRDGHLKSVDFFDVENHPTITFKTSGINTSSATQGTVSGELTIRGVTKAVAFDVEFLGAGVNPYGKTVAGFSATTKINREDYGLMWNVALEAGGVLVGKDVTITLDLQAVQA
jgi:polyisoprenoid-binding protein YceI